MKILYSLTYTSITFLLLLQQQQQQAHGFTAHVNVNANNAARPTICCNKQTTTLLSMAVAPLLEEGDWAAYRDDNTGLVYYFNGESGESLWEKPYETFPDLAVVQGDEKKDSSSPSGEGTLKLFSKLFEKKEENVELMIAAEEEKAEAASAFVEAADDAGASVFSGALNFFQSSKTTVEKTVSVAVAEAGVVKEESKTTISATVVTTENVTLEIAKAEEEEEDSSSFPSPSFKMPDMISGMFQRKEASTSTTTAAVVDVIDEKKVDATKQKEKQKASQAKAFKGAKPKKSTATATTKEKKTKLKEVKKAARTGVLPVELEVSARVLPHPDKVRWGGEDAVFFRGRTFGVFDGVSGADKEDGKPLYSTTLAEQMNLRVGMEALSMDEMTSIMTECAELADDCATGASTALSASIGEDNKLRVLNVGDCKLILLRDGAVVGRSRDIVHYFDCPYQMGGESPDRPKDGTKLVTQVKKGDTVVMGSDGIFDNLSESRMCEIITETSWSPKLPLVVKKIIDEARLVSFDETAETPYAKEAKKNRYEEYKDGLGGKLDDVSCIVVRCV